MPEPRIRTANKYPAPWKLNEFPADFAFKVGSELIAHLAVDRTKSIEGPTWERMFATAIGAEWEPSNVGLDDIVLKDCAWGAKTVKAGNPFETKVQRLICGRNDPTYSYGKRPSDLQKLGGMVLSIWNKRLAEVKKNYRHVRSVVLLKGASDDEWLDFAVFEFEPKAYDLNKFKWTRNKRRNLEGRDENGTHRFTWQNHGAQFTIIHQITESRLKFQVKRPAALEAAKILTVLAFEKGWVKVVPN